MSIHNNNNTTANVLSSDDDDDINSQGVHYNDDDDDNDEEDELSDSSNNSQKGVKRKLDDAFDNDDSDNSDDEDDNIFDLQHDEFNQISGKKKKVKSKAVKPPKKKTKAELKAEQARFVPQTIWAATMLSEDERDQRDEHDMDEYYGGDSAEMDRKCEICRVGNDLALSGESTSSAVTGNYNAAISLDAKLFNKLPELKIAEMIVEHYNSTCIVMDKVMKRGLKPWTTAMVIRHFRRHAPSVQRILWDKIKFLDRSLKHMTSNGIWNRVYIDGTEQENKALSDTKMSTWIKMTKMQTDLIKLSEQFKMQQQGVPDSTFQVDIDTQIATMGAYNKGASGRGGRGGGRGGRGGGKYSALTH